MCVCVCVLTKPDIIFSASERERDYAVLYNLFLEWMQSMYLHVCVILDNHLSLTLGLLIRHRVVFHCPFLCSRISV